MSSVTKTSAGINELLYYNDTTIYLGSVVLCVEAIYFC